jgi:CubicO group peptidase (beta-lactamase class C family)
MFHAPVRGVLASVALLCLVSCGGGDPSPPGERYPLAAGQHVDSAGLEAARATLATNRYVHCLLVERDGVIVMEEYFNGSQADDFYDVRSVTKSVTSTLIGIAIGAGFIRDLDQTVGEYLEGVVPGLPPDTRRISLRHLLTMASGLPFREREDFPVWVNAPDPLSWILNRPLEHEPGTYWHYNTGASHIPSAMLSVATGQSARDFAQARLFGPLETEIGFWILDPRGYNYGGHGIYLQGRSLVKFGRLFLDGGLHHGQQVVPADWVREASVARYPTTNDGVTWASGYGYFWWSDRDAATGRSYYFAAGYGGQFVVAVPSANTVIVATTAWSGVPDADADFGLVLRTIIQRILPSLG